MTVRRMLGLLTMLLMSHLMLVGPASTCAEHDTAGQSAAVATPGHSGMSDHGMGGGESKIPCETPSSAHCCDAVTSCTVAAAIDAPARSLPELTIAQAVPVSAPGQLLARAVAPEPPPPRA